MKLPLGFRYASTYAGIRRDRRDDLALIVPHDLATAAALFTTNLVQAAPVRVARRHLRASAGRLAAILVNAGNANCATRTGEKVAVASCRAAARALDSKAKYILPASTGVIGVELDSQLLTAPLPQLARQLSPERFHAAAEAILTTDRRAKVAAEEVPLKAGVVRIAGMTKGAGMIQPRMATTLGFLLTDAAIASRHLHHMLLTSAEPSYHALTIDGEMSTNDTLVLVANGASGVSLASRDRALFQAALTRVMEDLARQIAADGEGARKRITVRVDGCRTEADARSIARAIGNSPLVKTAIAGNDPNWGRILAAAGYSGAAFEPQKVSIALQKTLVCRSGRAVPTDEAELTRLLDAADVEIAVTIGNGKSGATIYTCDLTEDYIRINGSYRT